MPNLTGNAALDVAIGLAFVFLLFSVLCSAVQELIAGVLDLRAATLEKGLRNLLDDPGGKTGGAPAKPLPDPPGGSQAVGGQATEPPQEVRLSDQVLGHGLVRTLYKDSHVLFRRKRRGPSYIPAPVFARSLLDLVAPDSTAADPLSAVHQAIGKADLPPATKNALLALVKDAGSDRDKLRAAIEHWFDATMDRVSGWYKRKTQIIICVLSALVTIGLNVNTVTIADRLIHDDTLRAAVATQAVGATANSGGSATSATSSDLQKTVTAIEGVQRLGLPIGWNKQAGDPARVDLSGHPGRTLIGWLLTFLALSLGAPFWFDALSKLAGLRNAGAKPESSTG
jgi:hypothetical protein